MRKREEASSRKIARIGTDEIKVIDYCRDVRGYNITETMHKISIFYLALVESGNLDSNVVEDPYVRNVKYRRISYLMYDSVAERLDECARMFDISFSEVTRRAIITYGKAMKVL